MTATMDLRIVPTNASRLSSIDFGHLPFSTVFSDHMVVAEFRGGQWQSAEIRPYGPLPLVPNISGLQYGVSAFDALKAYRSPAGRVLLFRPLENARRLNRTARRLAMPEVPETMFLDCLRSLVKLDADWVPPAEAGALYVRASLFSVDPSMRVRAAEEFLFVIFTSPFGAYYSGSVDALVSSRYVRAFPGGTGDVKPAGNYAPTLLPDREAQAEGFGTVLWLDGQEHRYVEECGVMNVFFVVGDRVLTPALSGTILAGVTRDSAIQVLRDSGHSVEERRIAIDEVLEWHAKGVLRECFGTGTAATVTRIGRIRYNEVDLVIPANPRDLATDLRARLIAIMSGTMPDPYGWVDVV
jgi:branched-chain amino acid aminotransferase